MAVLTWDDLTNRTYETGLDRGVLYLAGGTGIPWNGLTSIVEHTNKVITSVYFDGKKISDKVAVGDYSATMQAMTYPDEFMISEGYGGPDAGFRLSDQPSQSFGLSYRTRLGNAAVGDNAGYKIHILYNLTAVPDDKTYVTDSIDANAVIFEWVLSAVPEEVSGYAPTAHVVVDTLLLDSDVVASIENLLYGTEETDASLPSIGTLLGLI